MNLRGFFNRHRRFGRRTLLRRRPGRRGYGVGLHDGFRVGPRGVDRPFSANTVTLSATAGSASDDGALGGTADVSLEVNNPNAYAVTLRSVTPHGTITADAAPFACTTTGVTFTPQTGLATSIPANANGDRIDLASFRDDEHATCSNGSWSGYATFSIPGHDHGAEVMSLRHALPRRSPATPLSPPSPAGAADHGRRTRRAPAGIAFAFFQTSEQLNPAAASAASLSPVSPTAAPPSLTAVNISLSISVSPRFPGPSTWSSEDEPQRRNGLHHHGRRPAGEHERGRPLPGRWPLARHRLQLFGHGRARQLDSLAGIVSFTPLAYRPFQPRQRHGIRRQLERLHLRHVIGRDRDDRLERQGVDPTGIGQTAGRQRQLVDSDLSGMTWARPVPSEGGSSGLPKAYSSIR